MPTEAISKLQPHRTLYLRGFDRRGCFAAMTQASASGFTVSGAWSDQADFVVLMLFDADDQFGHLLTNRYLPDFSLAGVTLDFDLVVRGCMSPIGPKYQSVPWGALSYINSSEASGVVPLPAPTSTTGGVAASAFFSIVGTPTNWDRIQIVYLGNEVFDSANFLDVITTGQTLAQVAANMAALINSCTSSTVPLSATSAGITTTVAASIAIGSQTVMPADMTDIVLGTVLTVANSDGSNSEIVTVTAVTPTTFTAVFASTKTGPGITVNGGVLAITCTQPGRDGNGIALLTMYKTPGNTQIFPFGRLSTASGQTTMLTGGSDPTSMHFHLDFSALGLASCRQIWLTLAPWLTYGASTVTFNFLNSYGTGYSHFITIGPNTYTYAQLAGDSSAAIAVALAGLIAAGDPNATAAAHSNQVTLALQTNVLASVACSASDGNGRGTLVNSTLCSLLPYASMEFSMVFSNWTVVDPGGVTGLKVAGPGSVTVGSRDAWALYSGTGWSLQVGSYFHGFAQQSSHATDSVTVTYWCQQAHNLYLGTELSTIGGEFSVSLDGAVAVTINTDADALSPVYARRLIAAGVAAGNHTVVLTVASGTCLFDYLQAAVLSDPVSPAKTYSKVSAAADFDTDQTYKIPPARVLWNYQQLGLHGDLDFYAGVFFALKRVRNGGSFHSATVTLTGPFGTGTGFGDGDSFYVDISGTSLGVAVYPADDPGGLTLAQRLIDAVNGTFVGVWAAPTSTPGQFTVTVLSPINGFTMTVSQGVGSTGTVEMSGDLGMVPTSVPGVYYDFGNEGTWQVDASQASPLNRAFLDYLYDLCELWHAAGMTVTVAFSQELLAPPDANTAAGAWTQRFAEGTQVLTATGFGTWGAGFVEAVNGSNIQQTGHGYITGNTWHAAGTGSGAWVITVFDADHFSLTTEVSNSGGYTPSVGDAAYIELQTSQSCFNPATVTAFLAACYVQAASILSACGLTPWLQFGEVLWWFFDWCTSTSDGHHIEAGMAYYDANTSAAAQAALGRALAMFSHATDDPSINGYADANFLRARIKAHIDGIRVAVLAVVPGAQFELLWPYDVNYPTQNAYGVGGQLNRYVNLPIEYQQQSGSGLNRLKMEALSFGSQERNFAKAYEAMTFPWTSPMAWTRATSAYLIPWFNGGCPWDREWLAVSDAAANPSWIGFWAIDHLCSFGWPLPLPVRRSTFQIQ
jgi:hypothetical protein